jgi:hypothetical protein
MKTPFESDSTDGRRRLKDNINADSMEKSANYKHVLKYEVRILDS